MAFKSIFNHINYSTVLLLTLTAITNISPVRAQVTIPTSNSAQTTLYVNPQLGTDNPTAGKSETSPLRTISYALEQATPGTLIQLASGRYYSESFPLVIKSGIILKGNENTQGQGIEIIGGDSYLSRTFAKQNVTLVAQDNSQIAGVTITNPNMRGTGIWVESGQPIIRNSYFINNKREGVFITGNAAPTIENNRFFRNDANGVSITSSAKGEIRNNIFDNTGFGIAIGGNSTPLLSDNQIRGNRNGIVLTDSAQPKLLSNLIENNTDYGLVIIGQSQPSLERNTFKDNKKQDQFRVIPTLQPEAPIEK
jgi:parallel beta-helix repeat protein